jgi:penicillin-binding protein 1C
MHRFSDFLQKFNRQPKFIRLLFRSLAAVFLLFGIFLLLDFCFPFRVKIRYSPLVLARDSTVLYAYLSSDDKWRMQTALPEISPQLREAIIFKEDRYFHWHFGINPVAIAKALINNVLQNKKTSGASTITMQAVRLLEPKSRTYWHKTGEMLRALQLEWHYSKDEILQLYLNLVPYGGNVEGVKSASVLYFGRLPQQLSLAQVMTLTIIPNRPTSLYLGRNNARIEQERNRWLRKLPASQTFPEKDIADALAEPLEAVRREAPKMAPHFARRVLKKSAGQAIILTSLDKNIQEKVQNLAYNYSRRLKSLYINNLAVLVLNNQTRQAVAYIGSPDFEDMTFAGQVDGVKAIRSPGSTLKPLVYALGFDEGKITPKTVLLDVPAAFGNFVPDNFDEKFNGKISAEKALSLSLNIPAVKVLEEVGLPLMLQKLKVARFRQIEKDANKLGLSLALGGCGVSLEELAGLYAAFANAGRFSPVAYFPTEKPENQVLFSAAAAFVITKTLMLASRPDLPNGFEQTLHLPRIAWKTGTSYGRRDAWSIGFNHKYTVAVWTGNFSGMGVHELSGADIATPLLFSIFNTLDYNSSNDWLKPPNSLKTRVVCSETGKIPADFCQSRTVDFFLPLVSPSEKCEHLKEIPVSENEKMSYCTACLPMQKYIRRLYPNLPAELVDFYETEHLAYEKIPVHNPDCQRITDREPPKILMPSADKAYLVEKDSPPQLQLYCQADNEVKTVYWYINDRFYRSAKVQEKVFFKPGLGKIKISCSDDKGRNTDIRITVGEL